MSVSPSPERLHYWRSVHEAVGLDVVSEAIAEALPVNRWALVERREAGWRWSPAHRGGPYPLLRVVARLLDVSHHTLLLSYTTHRGWAYACAPEQLAGDPLATKVLEFDPGTTPEAIAEEILRKFRVPKAQRL